MPNDLKTIPDYHAKRMVLLDVVVASAAELDRIYENLQGLKNEWKGLRDNIRQRMEPLQTRQTELEEVILDYLRSNNLPGVKLNGTMFMKEEVPSYKTKEAKIEDILKNEPPTTNPEVMTKKIVAALRKRQVVPGKDASKTEQDAVYRLKIFRS